MASKTEIVNAALHKLGAKRISSFSDDSHPNADLARDTYDGLRDKLLADRKWNFALRRASLPEDATAPVHGYDHAYSLPSGGDDGEGFCLRVVAVVDDDDQPTSQVWRQEGRKIVTDLEAPLKIVYLARVLDVDAYPPGFREALVTYLAREWAKVITAQTETTREMAALHEDARSEASANDSQVGTPEEIIADTWTSQHR